MEIKFDVLLSRIREGGDSSTPGTVIVNGNIWEPMEGTHRDFTDDFTDDFI